MTGESGWDVDPTTRGVLLHVESLGYVVSVHRLPSSLRGTIGPSIELHAVRLGDRSETHVAKIANTDREDDVYGGACALAKMVGINMRE